ncbi:hypothetical protein KKG71_01645 [Patescibacteria group bacterium]|nr:hypothetical protein [Patescibacteria group bacterium]
MKVVKNPKESLERLVNRFQKKVTQSRKLLQIKQNKFHHKKDTKRQVRGAAVMREYYRAKREKMQYY